MGMKTGGEDKVRSCRRDLEEEHHVITASWVHQVRFEYLCYMYIIFGVLSDDVVTFDARIIKVRSCFTRYIIFLGRFRSNNIFKETTNRKIFFDDSTLGLQVEIIQAFFLVTDIDSKLFLPSIQG